MKKILIFCMTVLLLLFHSVTMAQPTKEVVIPKIAFENGNLIITNPSGKPIDLRNTKIEFNYIGRVNKVMSLEDKSMQMNLNRYESSFHKGGQLYSISLQQAKNSVLEPKATLKLALETDKKDVPNNFRFRLAPTPVNVKISVSNSNWIQTISICNISGATVPLNTLEFSFNYSIPMTRMTIWGEPWVAWRLASQNGQQVVLVGGTPWSPSLPSDPNCTSPLTIRFHAAPTAPAPTGPFVFKAENSPTGGLNVMLGVAPAPCLPNPVLTVTGPGTNLQNTVTWGSAWVINDLSPGTYTISGAPVTHGTQSFTVDPVAAIVASDVITNQALSYKETGINTVTVSLTNPPTPQVPINLMGSKFSFKQTTSNGGILSLPNDTYTVSSDIPGYTAAITPNPMLVPGVTRLNISYIPIPSTGYRTINFVNQCPFPVWFGFISGATPNRNGGNCMSDADCYAGSTCVNRGRGGNQCFWKNPIPANNNFQLAANGGTNLVQIPIIQNPLSSVFSGALAGRTNCTANGCETADCGGGTGGCPAGRGFGQPATQAEFTFNNNAPDYYNIEMINGFNLPVSMAVVGSTPSATDPYRCGTAGGIVAATPMGICSWNFTPPSIDYNWVRPGGAACTVNANCNVPEVCGLSFNPGQNPALKKTCGKRLGYWTANQVCGIQSNYGAPFNCQQPLPAPQQNLNLTNLYGCTQVGSCYQNNANNTCCGCVNWNLLGIGVPPAPFTQQCKSANPTWLSSVLPKLQWMKTACPSMYTYPYDDASSTFICQKMVNDNGAQVNSVNYTITFCPAGKTGGV